MIQKKVFPMIPLQFLIPAITVLFLAMFIGCEDKNVEVVGVCPAVISTNPTNGAIVVPLDQIITMTFNEGMNPVTITQASFTLQDAKSSIMKSSAAVISGTLTYDGPTATMTFTPNALLTINTTFTATIMASIKDLKGNALQSDYIWTFSTGATLAPTVISIDPAKDGKGIFLNKIVTATFSVPMDPLTLNTTTFTINQGTTAIAGTISYTGTTASFKPTVALTSSTIYTVTITSGAKSKPGTALANNYVWTFTTGSITAPTVISTGPLDLAAGVALNKIVTATFSVPMNPSTLITPATTFTLKLGTTSVPGTVTYSGTTASFTSTSNLFSDSTYTATITTGAQNVAGTPLANNYVWKFSTIGHLGTVAPDLKSVARFGIIAGVGVSNNAGPSVINNLDVGIYPGARTSITGFPPASIVGGAMYASDDIAPPGVPAMLVQAKLDLTAAYLFAEGATSPAPATVAGDQGGKTLAPGIYKSTSTLLIQSGDLTLDAQGDVNAVWIFQIASDFTTVGGAGGNVILSGGAQAKNVFWQTGSSATIGDYTSFNGNVLALTSITMNSHANAVGRMLARNGAVVLTSTNIITKP